MRRTTFLVIPVMLLALAGCGGSKDATKTASGASASPGVVATTSTGATATANPADCPTSNTRKLAKTRFVANAAIAAGAFKRYLYKPYQAGTFKSGASGRKKAIVKAGVASVVIVDQLRRAKNNVEANPTLCKVLKAPLTKLTATMSALVNKAKQGELDPSELTSAQGALEQFRKDATSAGAGFKDKNS